MNQKIKEAAINKYSAVQSESADMLGGLIKEENPELTFGNVIEILEGIKTLKEASKVPEQPKVEMRTYDMWRGELVMVKERRVHGTNQREITEMQFQFMDSKPKKTGIRLPLTGNRSAEFWNQTHFTARRQVTDMLFPQGTKQDLSFKLNDEIEKFEIIVKELETA